MADDQVWIDPEFSPPPPGKGPGRWLQIVGIVAVAVAAFAYGWLLRSPSPTESEPDEAAFTSSTALTDESASTSTTTRPSAATTNDPPGPVGLGVPLEEAIPGFTDSITMAVWSDSGIDVMRWQPSEPAAEMMVSFPDDQRESFVGLDASGNWLAIENEIGVVSVRPLLGAVSPGTAADVDEAWEWPTAFQEAVAVRVISVAWHDTEPGQLAWLTCWGTPGRSGTLSTLDVTDSGAEPVPVGPIERVCSEDPGVWLGGWGVETPLDGWGDWGFALERWEEDRSEFVLLDVDGTEVAAIRNDSSDVVVSGAGGTVVTEVLPERGLSSSLISVDGQRRDPVPGLADDEWADTALWSPDGSLLALSLWRSATEVRVIRIVEVATGVEIAEFTEPYREVWPMAWSGDGRFFFYELVCERSASGLCEGPAGATTEEPPVVWVVYDTETDLAQSFSLPEGRWVMEIRSNEEPSPAEELTPVEWGIIIDEARPGVHTVGTIVDVRPLTPDHVDETSGRLIWDETVVDLCGIDIREVGPGFVHVGDIFGSDEGCGSNPTAMQDAFDEFGLPVTACVAVRVAGFDHEYCAPLS